MLFFLDSLLSQYVVISVRSSVCSSYLIRNQETYSSCLNLGSLRNKSQSITWELFLSSCQRFPWEIFDFAPPPPPPVGEFSQVIPCD